ncbi:MAG TPA: nuclear transport factor 2 family protein [Trebonia sp.]|jgi:ketosteroid isomerase-like protein
MKRDVVREYYEAVHGHDWAKLESTLSLDVVRMGIRSDFDDDTVRGRDRYVRFVAEVIGTFEDHSMEIVGIFYSPDGRFACAQTVETLRQPGRERVRLHCLKWHELDGDGLIVKIDQYRKGSPEPTPASLTVGAVRSARDA